MRTKTDRTDRAERRATIAQMHADGFKQREMAETLKISTKTIQSDLAHVRANHEAAAVATADEHRERLAGELQRARAEAWKGWQRSLEPQERTKVTSRNPDGVTTKVKGAGEPRFLELVGRLTLQEAELRGLVAERVDGAGGGNVVINITREIVPAGTVLDLASSNPATLPLCVQALPATAGDQTTEQAQ